LPIGYDKAMTVLHSGAVIMTPHLEQIYQDLSQITSIERWQILEHLIGQFRNVLGTDQVAPVTTPRQSAEEILAATRGSWGTQSLDEIDAKLAHQRQLDWGE
jgi:hypothetical protein